jgi:hypothetical protein
MSRRRLLLLVSMLIAAAIAAGLAVAADDQGNNRTFEYAVGLWGDMPYSDTQAQTGVPNLIADMNNSDIAFSVHDGDLKAGNGIPGSATPTTCADALYTQALSYFNSLKQPAMFTTGDNDWTDCDRPKNGGFDSLERLQHERQLFFSTDQSLGQKTMTQEVQSTPLCIGTTDPDPTHGATFQTPCTENRRWTYKKVTYATLNVQGSCNNLCDTLSATDPAEYNARKVADIAWLEQTFDEANSLNSAGVMIIWQGDPGFDMSGYQGAPLRDPTSLAEMDGNPEGIHDILVKLRDLTIAFKKPVALVHGDSHYFMVDKPLVDSQGRLVENFTRVETFGDNTFTKPTPHPEWDNNHVFWVKALVDPNSRDVFAFQAQIVPRCRPEQPRRPRLPGADRAPQPGRRPTAVALRASRSEHRVGRVTRRGRPRARASPVRYGKGATSTRRRRGSSRFWSSAWSATGRRASSAVGT